MKLKSIELVGVGRHRGEVLRGLGDGLTVVYGENEAGKSTLLAGLRGVLFGKVASGEPGLLMDKGAEGRLVVETSAGLQFAIERSLGRKSPVKVTCPNGDVVSGHDVLKELLPELKAVEDVVYQSVFTFQLAELNDFAQADQAVKSRIYTVGMMGKRSPLEIEMALWSQAKEIFNPHKRARNPKLVQCLQEIDRLQQTLLDKRDTPADYEYVQQRLAESKARFEEMEAHLVLLQSQRAQVMKDKDGLPLHQDAVRIRAYLHETFPEQAVTEEQRAAVTDANRRLEASRERSKAMEMERQVLETRLALIHVRPGLIRAIQPLRTLLSMASGVSEQIRQAAEKLGEVSDLQNRLTATRAQLSACWQDEGVEAIHITVAARHEAEQAAQRMQALARDLEGVERDVGHHQFFLKQHEKALAQHGIAEGIVAGARTRQVQVHDDQIRDGVEDEERLLDLSRHLESLRTLAAERSAWEGTLGGMQAQQAAPKVSGLPLLLWLLAGFSIALSGVEVLAHKLVMALPTGIVGLFIAVVGFYVFKRGGPVTMGAPLDGDVRLHTLNANIRSLEDKMESVALSLVTVRVDWRRLQDVDEARREVRKSCAEHAAKKTWIETALQLHQQLEGVRGEQRRLGAERDRVLTELHLVQEQWMQSLRDIGIESADMSPAVFLKEAELVSQVRADKHVLEQKQAATEQLNQSVLSYLASVEEVLSTLEQGRSGTAESASALGGQTLTRPLSVDAWKQRLERAIDAAELQENLERERQEGVRQLARAMQPLQEEYALQATLTATILEIYTVLQIQDVAAFEHLLEKDRERSQWDADHRESLSKVYGHYGGHEVYEQRITVLNETPKALFDERVEQLADEMTALKEQSLATAKEMGELEQRLQTWQDGPSTLELEWSLAMAKAERAALSQHWARYTVAAHLMREAREKFEENRRPQSLIHAGDVFREITGGRYVGFKARADDKGVTRLICLDKQGKEWELAQLSRGTREQVYLALRLAVIHDYKERGVDLPVVLDDVMVNFDNPRLNASFDVLQACAKGSQFIYLTCQRQLAEYATAHREVNLVTLD